ncbi:MAG: AAC(3) family N-acetyltransferase [bacterium]|nr:AAC(3) family N-acetyltransferase [bacterium]
MIIDKETIIKQLRQFGLSPGDVVVLHSSLSSIGQVIGGANSVIDALMNVIDPNGTLVVPTFTFSFKRFGEKPPPFCPTESASLCGLISDTLWRRPDAHRSLHPTHSVAAIGFFAREMVKGHDKTTPLGIGSPYHKLSQIGGLVMLLGVGPDQNFLLYTAEKLAGVPYLHISYSDDKNGTEIARVKSGDEIIEVPISEVPGCNAGFVKAESLLRERGIVEEGMVGKAKTELMKAENVIEVLSERLQSDPFFLLCDNPGCQLCVKRKRITRSKLRVNKQKRSIHKT